MAALRALIPIVCHFEFPFQTSKGSPTGDPVKLTINRRYGSHAEKWEIQQCQSFSGLYVAFRGAGATEKWGRTAS
jgi:hypothetical protein